jgi:hypothetical protein
MELVVQSEQARELKECVICLHDILPNSGCTLDCNHTFHCACYNTFLVHELRVKQTNTVLCPVCRNCIVTIIQEPMTSQEANEISAANEDGFRYLSNVQGQEGQEVSSQYNRHRLCFAMLHIGIIIIGIWVIISLVACSSDGNNALC